MNSEQLKKMRNASGFIAALDQSGGSTAKALTLYGLDDTAYSSEGEMFDRIHEMRARIITSPAITPPLKTFDEPAILVNSLAKPPAVTDSATERLNPFFVSFLKVG